MIKWSTHKTTRSRRSSDRITSLIAHDIIVYGNVHFETGVQIDGTVKGRLQGLGEAAVVRVSHQGCVEGDIEAPVIIIDGRVTGSVYSHQHLELGQGCEIDGEVHYNLIEMASGAKINGQLMHHEAGEQTDHASAQNLSIMTDRRSQQLGHDFGSTHPPGLEQEQEQEQAKPTDLDEPPH